jgi:predicted GIY-YIG superfamily endonuclease
MASDGIVYLLHFERCYRARCRHYVGWTQDLENRIRKHREGTAKSVTTKRAYDQGIGFVVARTWVGSPELERQIKARGPSNYCPLCPRHSPPSD